MYIAVAHRIANVHDYQQMLWTASNASISSAKRTCEWALTFFPHPTSFACHSRVTSLDIPYASVKSNCAHPPQLHCGAFAYHVSPGGGGISKFCVARGSGICLPRDLPRAFSLFPDPLFSLQSPSSARDKK